MPVILLKILKANPCSLTRNRNVAVFTFFANKKSPLKKEEISNFGLFF